MLALSSPDLENDINLAAFNIDSRERHQHPRPTPALVMRNMEALVLVLEKGGRAAGPGIIEYLGREHRFAALKVTEIRPALAVCCLTNSSPLLVEQQTAAE